MTKQTDLYDCHIEAGAKMTTFFGWDMPLHYGSQLQEHAVVRESAGMFDVSHMLVVDLLGTGCRQFLRQLLANDIDKLEHSGSALYSCMLNHHGGIVDDLIVYNRAVDNYRLVLNAGRAQADLDWLTEQADGFDVGIQQRNDLAMLAVQGPEATEKTMAVLDAAKADSASTLSHFEAAEIDEWFIARTGYTGEQGYEIILPKTEIVEFWQALLNAGVKPCGLGARDSLRLEAGLMLYGQDMDETTTPLESALSWTVAWEPQDREFIGRAALELQREQGVPRKLVGLVLDGKHIMRPGYPVWVDAESHGEITSGTYSPTLQKPIAFARVPASVGDTCDVEIRQKRIRANVVKPRFVKNGKIL